MGQSIQHITLTSIAQEALKGMADNVNKYILKNDFRLGGGHCEDSQMDSEMLYSIIHNNFCEVVEVLEGSLEGETTLYSPDMTVPMGPEVKNQSKIALYELWLSRGNTGTMDDFLDILFNDEKMNWYEINW